MVARDGCGGDNSFLVHLDGCQYVPFSGSVLVLIG